MLPRISDISLTTSVLDGIRLPEFVVSHIVLYNVRGNHCALNIIVVLMSECFLSHTIQFNVLCVFVLMFLFSMCYFNDFIPTFSL